MAAKEHVFLTDVNVSAATRGGRFWLSTEAEQTHTAIIARLQRLRNEADTIVVDGCLADAPGVILHGVAQVMCVFGPTSEVPA